METAATEENQGASATGRRSGDSSVTSVDLELLEKYDIPVPRYTSYPSVSEFAEATNEEARIWLEADANHDRPLSLYFHIPYCQQLCWYCACNRIVSKEREVAEPYVQTLLRELEVKGPTLSDRTVEQVHLGGGTPTFLPAEQLRRLGRALHDRFEFADDAEVAIEIDPRHCSEEQVEALREVGFNRASLGVQDHDPQVQRAINRRQPYALTAQVVEWLREAGFESINFDLVYGLPKQSEESFRETLDDLVELKPDRLAIYSYAHVPWKHPAQKHLEREGLPDSEMKLQLLKIAVEYLTDAGYEYIGLDHFARPEDELAQSFEDGRLRRNFQGYGASRGTDVHAFGVSAISQTERTYIQNAKEMNAYRAAVDDGTVPAMRGYVLNRDDRIRRATIERIMCRPRVQYDELNEQFDIGFRHYFADELQSLENLAVDELVELGERELRITRRGRLFLRNIASRFDAFLDGDRKRFSSAV